MGLLLTSATSSASDGVVVSCLKRLMLPSGTAFPATRAGSPAEAAARPRRLVHVSAEGAR